MKVGDLVRFQDISNYYARPWQHINGSAALIVKLYTSESGGKMVRALINGVYEDFHPSYFEEIAGETS